MEDHILSTPLPRWPRSQGSASKTTAYDTAYRNDLGEDNDVLVGEAQLSTPYRKLIQHHATSTGLKSGARRVILTQAKEEKAVEATPAVTPRDRGHYMKPTEAYKAALEDALCTPQRSAKKAVAALPWGRTPTRQQPVKATPETSVPRHQHNNHPLLQRQHTPTTPDPARRHLGDVLETPIRSAKPSQRSEHNQEETGATILFSPPSLSHQRSQSAGRLQSHNQGSHVSSRVSDRRPQQQQQPLQQQQQQQQQAQQLQPARRAASAPKRRPDALTTTMQKAALLTGVVATPATPVAAQGAVSPVSGVASRFRAAIQASGGAAVPPTPPPASAVARAATPSSASRNSRHTNKPPPSSHGSSSSGTNKAKNVTASKLSANKAAKQAILAMGRNKAPTYLSPTFSSHMMRHAADGSQGVKKDVRKTAAVSPSASARKTPRAAESVRDKNCVQEEEADDVLQMLSRCEATPAQPSSPTSSPSVRNPALRCVVQGSVFSSSMASMDRLVDPMQDKSQHLVVNEITDTEGEKIDERNDESTISSVHGATEGPVTVLSCQASLDLSALNDMSQNLETDARNVPHASLYLGTTSEKRELSGTATAANPRPLDSEVMALDMMDWSDLSGVEAPSTASPKSLMSCSNSFFSTYQGEVSNPPPSSQTANPSMEQTHFANARTGRAVASTSPVPPMPGGDLSIRARAGSLSSLSMRRSLSTGSAAETFLVSLHNSSVARDRLNGTIGAAGGGGGLWGSGAFDPASALLFSTEEVSKPEGDYETSSSVASSVLNQGMLQSTQSEALLGLRSIGSMNLLTVSMLASPSLSQPKSIEAMLAGMRGGDSSKDQLNQSSSLCQYDSGGDSHGQLISEAFSEFDNFSDSNPLNMLSSTLSPIGLLPAPLSGQEDSTLSEGYGEDRDRSHSGRAPSSDSSATSEEVPPLFLPRQEMQEPSIPPATTTSSSHHHLHPTVLPAKHVIKRHSFEELDNSSIREESKSLEDMANSAPAATTTATSAGAGHGVHSEEEDPVRLMKSRLLQKSSLSFQQMAAHLQGGHDDVTSF
eukprot:gene1354-1476_t